VLNAGQSFGDRLQLPHTVNQANAVFPQFTIVRPQPLPLQLALTQTMREVGELALQFARFRISDCAHHGS
jgi:hypothetical protein